MQTLKTIIIGILGFCFFFFLSVIVVQLSSEIAGQKLDVNTLSTLTFTSTLLLTESLIFATWLKKKRFISFFLMALPALVFWCVWLKIGAGLFVDILEMEGANENALIALTIAGVAMKCVAWIIPYAVYIYMKTKNAHIEVFP